MAAYGNDNTRLNDHGSRFVCVLYFLARGIRNRGFDTDKVYGELGMEGFLDQQQARAEIVQFLEGEQPPRIEYDRGNNMVRLTSAGLQWAQRQCENRPYLDYRHLQN